MDTNNAQETKQETHSSNRPRFANIVNGAYDASLGISMVVAVLLGIGIGIGLEYITSISWLFWLGVVWGILAALLNVYKAYKRQLKDAEELAKNPRYAYKASQDEDDDEA